MEDVSRRTSPGVRGLWKSFSKKHSKRLTGRGLALLSPPARRKREPDSEGEGSVKRLDSEQVRSDLFRIRSVKTPEEYAKKPNYALSTTCWKSKS